MWREHYAVVGENKLLSNCYQLFFIPRDTVETLHDFSCTLRKAPYSLHLFKTALYVRLLYFFKKANKIDCTSFDRIWLCLRKTYICRNLAQIPKQMGKLEEQISPHWCPTQVSSNSTSMKWRLDSLAWFYTEIPRRHVASAN